jgi:hypothetical protein
MKNHQQQQFTRHPVCGQVVRLRRSRAVAQAVLTLFAATGASARELFATAEDRELLDAFARAGGQPGTEREFGQHCIRHAAHMSAKGLALSYVYERARYGIDSGQSMSELTSGVMAPQDGGTSDEEGT